MAEEGIDPRDIVEGAIFYMNKENSDIDFFVLEKRSAFRAWLKPIKKDTYQLYEDGSFGCINPHPYNKVVNYFVIPDTFKLKRESPKKEEKNTVIAKIEDTDNTFRLISGKNLNYKPFHIYDASKTLFVKPSVVTTELSVRDFFDEDDDDEEDE